MAHVGDSFHPGQKVPESGFYECDAGDSHRWSVNGIVFRRRRVAARAMAGS
jgi:hypothetical protein